MSCTNPDVGASVARTSNPGLPQYKNFCEDVITSESDTKSTECSTGSDRPRPVQEISGRTELPGFYKIKANDDALLKIDENTGLA